MRAWCCRSAARRRQPGTAKHTAGVVVFAPGGFFRRCPKLSSLWSAQGSCRQHPTSEARVTTSKPQTSSRVERCGALRVKGGGLTISTHLRLSVEPGRVERRVVAVAESHAERRDALGAGRYLGVLELHRPHEVMGLVQRLARLDLHRRRRQAALPQPLRVNHLARVRQDDDPARRGESADADRAGAPPGGGGPHSDACQHFDTADAGAVVFAVD